MKKTWFFLLLCLLIAGTCLLPFPVRVNTQLHGSYLANDMLSDDIVVSVQGWRYNFLFLEDRYEVDVTISTIPLSSHNEHRACVLIGTFSEPKTYYLFNLSAYRDDTHSLDNAYWAINSDCSTFMLHGFREDITIVASTDLNANLANIPDDFPILRDLCSVD